MNRAASFSLLFPLAGGLLALGCGSSSGGGGSTAGAATAPVRSGSATGTAGTASGGSASGGSGTAGGGTTPGGLAAVPPTAEARYYEPHVRSTLYTYCTRCHSDTSNAASAAYLLNGFPVDDTSFQNTLARIDVQDPENSLLLLKATGLVAHGGGAVLRVDEVATEWLLNWVRQGAVRDQYANAPSTFARNVRPFVTAQCSGCHSGGTGGFRAGGTLDQDYQSMLSHTDPGNPTGSSVLTKCDGSRGHAGGAPWRPPSAERDAILKWIADGRRFTQ